MTSIPPSQGEPQYPTQVAAPAPANGMGIAGFVTGLLGLIFCWVPFLGAILGALGALFGSVAIKESRNRGQNNGLAIAGLVCGLLAVLVFIALLIVLASAQTTRY